MFLYGFSHQRNEVKLINDVVVEFEEGDNLYMSYEMVNKLLIQKSSTLKNEAKSVIDLQELEANVLVHPMVEDASVYLTVDGILKTRIKQRTPIARVVTNNGSYYVDKQAKKMPLSANHSARVLLISGAIVETDTAKIFELVSVILNDEFLKKQIIGIQKTLNNEFILKTRVGDQTIIIGEIDNLYQKFKNLKSFLNKTMEDNSIENYSTINLKYNNQVVCTKK